MESIQTFSTLRSQRRKSKLVSRQVFNEHHRKKRRLHSNSIFNELKICDKLNQFRMLTQQAEINHKKKNRMCRTHQSQIFQNQKPQPSSLFFKMHKNLKKGESQKQNKEPMIIPAKKKIYTFGNVDAKLKQLKKISQAFDQVNNVRIKQTEQQQVQYKFKYTQTDKVLKDFSQKLSLRKNLITERKDSLKKNVIRDYRFKAMPKRNYTQQNESIPFQNNGIWFQKAQKLKNYICGGYSDQRQDYSDECCLQQYRKVKKNFLIFESIYNSVKEDKSNPISKVNNVNFKNPSTLQVISYLQRFQSQNI